MTIQLILHIIYLVVLVSVSYTDIRERRIPNKVVVPAVGIALAAMFYTPGWKSALLGAGTSALVLLIPVFAFGGRGGMGDVKLAFFIGLILGFPDSLFALIAAHLSAAMLWIGVLLKKIDRKSKIPFGPFLAFGAILFLVLRYL